MGLFGKKLVVENRSGFNTLGRNLAGQGNGRQDEHGNLCKMARSAMITLRFGRSLFTGRGVLLTVMHAMFASFDHRWGMLFCHLDRIGFMLAKRHGERRPSLDGKPQHQQNGYQTACHVVLFRLKRPAA